MVLETLKVDFKPLYQSIHIYTTLDSLDELRKSYQADRKVRSSKRILLQLLIIVLKAQSDLILPVPLQLSSLVALTEQIIGFFIIESHVLQTTGSFRSKAEVEELWDAIAARLADAVDGALRNVTDPDSYLHVKETLIAFILTLEVYTHPFYGPGIILNPFDSLGISILDIVSTCVGFPPIREVRYFTGTTIQQTLQRRKFSCWEPVTSLFRHTS
jgi:hypothetical protein